MNGDELQKMYDDAWQRFLEWAKDDSSKIASDMNIGREFGVALRNLSRDSVNTAALKAAFAAGWRANKPYRDKLWMRVAELESDGEASV